MAHKFAGRLWCVSDVRIATPNVLERDIRGDDLQWGTPLVITASAPVRVCDNGGWTDTWFGGPGRVLNIGVTPGAEVSIRTTRGPDPVVLHVDAFADRYSVVPGASRVARHPLLEAAIDLLPPPEALTVEVRVRSLVPAGSGTGTSASVAVRDAGRTGSTAR